MKSIFPIIFLFTVILSCSEKPVTLGLEHYYYQVDSLPGIRVYHYVQNSGNKSMNIYQKMYSYIDSNRFVIESDSYLEDGQRMVPYANVREEIGSEDVKVISFTEYRFKDDSLYTIRMNLHSRTSFTWSLQPNDSITLSYTPSREDVRRPPMIHRTRTLQGKGKPYMLNGDTLETMYFIDVLTIIPDSTKEAKRILTRTAFAKGIGVVEKISLSSLDTMRLVRIISSAEWEKIRARK